MSQGIYRIVLVILSTAMSHIAFRILILVQNISVLEATQHMHSLYHCFLYDAISYIRKLFISKSYSQCLSQKICTGHYVYVYIKLTNHHQPHPLLHPNTTPTPHPHSHHPLQKINAIRGRYIQMHFPERTAFQFRLKNPWIVLLWFQLTTTQHCFG